MAQLNVIQPNFGGLAALAGNQMGNLGINRSYPVPRQDTSAGEFMGGLASGLRQNQALEQDKQKQAMLEQKLSREEEMDQQKFAFEKEKFQAQQDMLSRGLAAEESKEKLEARALTSLMWLRMPEEQKTKFKPTILKALVDTGLGTEDMAEMDNKSIDALAMRNVVGSIDAMKMQVKNLDSNTQSGGSRIYDPNTGNLVYETQPLTTGAATEAQKSVNSMKVLESGLKELENLYDPEFLTWRSRIGRTLMTAAEKAEGLPGISEIISGAAEGISGVPEEKQKEMIYKTTKFVNKAEQIFQDYRKATTGAQASDREIKMLRKIFLNPNMGPTEFKAAMEVIVEAAQQKREINESQLMDGITLKVGDQKYNTASPQPNTQENKGTISVSAIMKAHPNMTKEQIILQAQEQGYNVRD